MKRKKRSKGAVAAEPLSITPTTRIREFPNLLFQVNCLPGNVSVKRSVIERDRNILKQYDKQKHPIEETLSDEARVYRVKVASQYIFEGCSSSFKGRSLLEERAFRLSDSSNLYQLIPFLHEEEKATIKKEIYERELSIIFDGTTENF